MSTEAPVEIESVPEPQAPPSRTKKKVVRRSAPDLSQKLRGLVQAVFFALNAWIGVQFYLWVRWLEHGSQGLAISRPAGVEGWLPIAGLINLKYFLTTGIVSPIHPAAMFLLIAFLLMSLLLKKAFCSWLCPVGTISEYLWKLGRKVFGRSLPVPRWLDIPLRSLRYLLLGFFVFIVAGMSAEALAGFMLSPYGIVADVKMLNFFRTIGQTGILVLGILVLLSALIENFWCRYLCPYGALMGLVSLLSPLKIRRDTEACIDCGKCSRACPSHLPVDQLVQIRSVDCSACMACVAVCPAENALQFALPPARGASLAERWRSRVARPQTVVALLACLFFGTVLIAHATGHWHMNLPQSVYQQLVPNANEITH